MAPADQEQLGSDLSAYLDGELSPQRARQIERLLEESEDARRLLARLRAVSQDLGDLPRVPAPESLAETIRHARERQAVERGRPAGGWRALKLVTRVVASAAVIVFCMFTGWMMHDRLASPAPTERYLVPRSASAPERRSEEALLREEVSGKSVARDVVEAEAPAVALRELRSLDYVGKDVDAEGEPAPSAETFPRDEETLVAARPVRSKLGGHALASAAPALGGDVRTDVSVVVAPNDPDQFSNTLQAISVWQGQTVACAGRMVAPPGREDGGRAGLPAAAELPAAERVGLAQQDFIVQVPPAQVAEMLHSLEDQAPEQVQVAMTFKPGDLSRVQRMVMSHDSPDLASESAVTESEPPAREPALAVARARGDAAFQARMPEPARTGRPGGRGSVARRAAQPQDSLAAREKAGARSRRSGRAGGGAGDAERAAEALGEPDVSVPDTRCPRAADVARPVSEAIRQQANAEPIAGRGGAGPGVIEEDVAADSSASGASALERVRALANHMDDVVTLRVTVLPPPQTTQPASATPPPAP